MQYIEKYKKIRASIHKINSGIQELRNLKVTRTVKLTSEIGEWLVNEIYQGKMATSSTQKGWDIKADGKRIQVKAHAKRKDNTAQWTVCNYNEQLFEEFVIVVFSEDYRLKKIIKLSFEELMKKSNKSGNRRIIYWKDCIQNEINLDTLDPHLLHIFK